MGNREDELKRKIEQSFGSIKKFCEASGIPRSTVYNILDRGVENTRTKTMNMVYSFIDMSDPLSCDSIDEDERELLDIFERMSARQRAAILEIARAMSE